MSQKNHMTVFDWKKSFERVHHNRLIGYKFNIYLCLFQDDPPSNPSKRLKEPISASVIAVNSDPTDIPNSHHVSQSSSSTAIPIPVKSEFVTPSVSVMAAAKLMRESKLDTCTFKTIITLKPLRVGI